MLPFEISETDSIQAKMERKQHKSTIIRDRMHAIYLLSIGFPRQECAQILGLSANTITTYIRLYNEGGLARLRQLNYRKPTSILEDFKEQIQSDIEQIKPSCIRQIRQLIIDKYGINRSLERVRVFLHRCGIRYRKLNPCPGPKDIDKWLSKQEEFLENITKPLIDKSLTKQIDLLFMDAAHFVQGKFDAYLWSQKPMYAPTSNGRYRINVLGGLDLSKRAILCLYNDHYISADTLMEYFEWLRQAHYRNPKRTLYILLDNARYQKCQLVQQGAKALNIELVYLPAYSPNLNLIERLWRHIKKLLGRMFFPDKKAFWEAIENILDLINDKEYQHNLKGVFNPNFQTFKKSKILAW